MSSTEAKIEDLKSLEYDFYAAKMMACILADTLDNSVTDLRKFDENERIRLTKYDVDKLSFMYTNVHERLERLERDFLTIIYGSEEANR